MSEWESRISIVEETIGTATDGYAALDDIVAPKVKPGGGDPDRGIRRLRHRPAQIAIDASRSPSPVAPLLTQQLNEHDKALTAYEALDATARACESR